MLKIFKKGGYTGGGEVLQKKLNKVKQKKNLIFGLFVDCVQ